MIRRVGAHIATIVVLLAVFLGIPIYESGTDPLAKLFGQTDLVSSATTVQAAPDGGFTIFINGDLHPDKEVLALWRDFLAGKDVPLIMEDVSCVVPSSDAAALEMAQSLASRLPANQMKVRLENPVLALSKAEAGRFDILVMSNDTSDAFDVSELLGHPNVEVIYR